MRRLVPALVAALSVVLTACAAGRPDGAATRPATPPPPAAHARSVAGSATLRVSLELDATAVRAGGTIGGSLTIANQTGKPIRFTGCGSFFQVVLRNRSNLQTPAWPACLQRITIPTGASSYHLALTASYSECSQDGASGITPACTPTGMPPLPAGTYKATTYLIGPAIPIPPPITVLVTPG